ncbi:MAG TPA: TetR family transcriptional regulator [Deltaproteobacteria bacterium]|jgi:AcrR family transcriptional regulator|nr:TetR family transcriptional regulator [Deltaproteobacteria bacterium]HOI08167.1 TetR family transcriptional regulator [Deltaproteobacteria bacterium]
MPPKATVTREEIIQAAFTIVDEGGMLCLTARSVAKETGLSTRPVYFYFSSMEELQKEVLKKAVDLLREYTTVPYTERVFLNMGIGIVLFARDHRQLFRNLFLESDEYKDLVAEFMLSLRDEMKKDPRFTGMTQEERDTLLNKMWVFTHGLASVICVGLNEEQSDRYIIDMIDQVGSVVIADAIKKSSNK